jgi:hypothetical protein
MRIHADLRGAFGFLSDYLYNLATAMVFGLTASASSWESFGQAIKAPTKVFATRPNLIIKHKKYLNMLNWEKINHSTKKVHAFPDDALMLATIIKHMKLILAAMIEAIFVVMGKPNESVRQCPLAMDNEKNW